MFLYHVLDLIEMIRNNGLLFFHLAVAQGYLAVGFLGKGCVVGNDDESLLVLFAQLEEEIVELGSMTGVEVARGFVGQHHSRVVDECPCHSETLLFAARELGGLMVGTCGDVEEIE